MPNSIPLDRPALVKAFCERFGSTPRLFHAPGRVNLIGEHTDYNDGYVLPAAIGLRTWAAASARGDRRLRVASEQAGETVELELDALDRPQPRQWTQYIRGVAAVLERRGLRLSGADVLVVGEVPLGAGLSSSASLEVSVGLALLRLSGHNLGPMELARACQQAEHEFAGTRCGLMDQFIACHGQAGHALLFDCRSLEYRALPLPPGVRLVICNSGVRHELASGEYNVRRAQCEEGVRLLSRVFPEARALRDLTPEHAAELPVTVLRRCRHVVSENERVLQTATALEAGHLERLGPLMAASHRSLRDDYEVSCRELDLLVELAEGSEGVLGARMTGGGFGGCTINLVQARAVEAFRRAVGEGYRRAVGVTPEFYVCEAGEGAAEV
jgi:galactokinase